MSLFVGDVASSDTESLRGLFATQAEMSTDSWNLGQKLGIVSAQVEPESLEVSKEGVYTWMWKMPLGKV